MAEPAEQRDTDFFSNIIDDVLKSHQVEPEVIPQIDTRARPISSEEVHALLSSNYQIVRETSDPDTSYGRYRGARDVLVPDGNDARKYAQLAGIGNKTPIDVVNDAMLSNGSTLLDLAAANGELLRDISEGEIGVHAVPSERMYAIDAFIGEKLKGMLGVNATELDIETLTRETLPQAFPQLGKDFGGFNLITGVALWHHLVDPWGTFGRMTKLLDKDGVILTSCWPRMISMDHHSIENEDGGFEEASYSDEPYTGQLYSSRGHSVVRLDTQGQAHLVSNKDVVSMINRFNDERFRLHLSIIPGDIMRSSGKREQGAQINGENVSGEGLNLGQLFYCKLQRLTYYVQGNKAIYDTPETLGYVIADTPEEVKKLQQQGYTSVDSF